MSVEWLSRLAPRVTAASLVTLAVSMLAEPPRVAAARSSEPADSCVDCHSDPDFLVTAKKLYEYYKEWQGSIHQQEGVTCSDCHGGNPELTDKDASHGKQVSGGLREASAVSFKNIPVTCGECHDEYYQAFRESDHYDHLIAKKQEKQGPNCVTCHGSINATVLHVNTVEEVCRQCHNEETENHPDIPTTAGNILNDFISIHRYYRYIGIRGDPVETKAFFEAIDGRIHDLSVLWHGFEVPKIEKETRFIIDMLKAKRAELRREHASQASPTQASP